MKYSLSKNITMFMIASIVTVLGTIPVNIVSSFALILDIKNEINLADEATLVGIQLSKVSNILGLNHNVILGWEVEYLKIWITAAKAMDEYINSICC